MNTTNKKGEKRYNQPFKAAVLHNQVLSMDFNGFYFLLFSKGPELLDQSKIEFRLRMFFPIMHLFMIFLMNIYYYFV